MSLPTSIPEFIARNPDWETNNLESVSLDPSFVVATSDWGSIQTTAYRVIWNRYPRAEDVVPLIELHPEAIRAVEDQLVLNSIPDASIEHIPTHELSTCGGELGGFFAALGNVLAKSTVETEPTRVQPARAAKGHRRTISIETTASRDSDLQDHLDRAKQERATEALVLRFLQTITSIYYTKKYPNRALLPRIHEFRTVGHTIAFNIPGADRACISINDGSLVLMKFDRAGHWVPALDVPACSIEVKREYSVESQSNKDVLIKDPSTLAQQAGEMIALAHAWSDYMTSPFYVFMITGAQQRVSISSAQITAGYIEYIREGQSSDIFEAHLEMRETRFYNLAKSNDRRDFAKIVLSVVEYQNFHASNLSFLQADFL